MLRSLKSLEGFHIAATDGDVGKAISFLFDDEHWTVRYLVVDTGGFWQGPHRVLVSPIAFGATDWSTRHFALTLDRGKVQNSPAVDVDRPVSRQYEHDFHRFYGWTPYWGFGNTWGLGTVPGALAGTTWSDPDMPPDGHEDPHLRSVHEVTGYEVDGKDGSLGHVADFIVDDESWTIRYLVIDTRKWWSGKKVLVSPRWARKIDWSKASVLTDIPREILQKSPEWEGGHSASREYETRLHDYYGQPGYWKDSSSARDPGSPIAPTTEQLTP